MFLTERPLPAVGRRAAAARSLTRNIIMMHHAPLIRACLTQLALLREIALAGLRVQRRRDKRPVLAPVARSRLWLRPAGRRSDR
eukprot:4849492-Alexandrium_andersonii.AAC.1